MNVLRIAAVGLVGTLLFSSCGQKPKNVPPLSGPPQLGALYSLNDGEGGYRAAKVIAVESEVIFTHFYGQRWTERPIATPANMDKPAPVAFSTETFAGMLPVQLAGGSVTSEEQEAYETWKQSKQDVF